MMARMAKVEIGIRSLSWIEKGHDRDFIIEESLTFRETRVKNVQISLKPWIFLTSFPQIALHLSVEKISVVVAAYQCLAFRQ